MNLIPLLKLNYYKQTYLLILYLTNKQKLDYFALINFFFKFRKTPHVVIILIKTIKLLQV